MRMILILSWCCLMLVASTVGKADDQAEVVRWDRAPISLSLPIGEERYVWFPGRVQPGIPPALTNKLRVQAVGDTIYLLAKEDFAETRLPVRDLDRGDFYLFDIKTDDQASTNPVRVVKASARDEQTLITSADQKTSQETTAAVDTSEIGYVTLTRFAAHQIYAPSRLARDEPGISKVPLPAAGDDGALYRGSEVTATPLASWRSRNGLYVTAVKVTNQTAEPVALDPRRARGEWLAATFHHRSLEPKGRPSDTSTLYLISDRPYLEAIASWAG